MLFLFRYHNMLPHEFYDLPFGEKRIVRQLINCEIEDRNAEYEEAFG
ncbi:MAG: hypothetical protein NC215_07000 [Ruminococcus sp.]|nr:hypothetical protein [Ruminococcus sp.]